MTSNLTATNDTDSTRTEDDTNARYGRTMCTLGAFAQHVSESEFIIRNVFADALETPLDTSQWRVNATEPNDPHEPLGNIVIDHPDFNEYTSVVITSTSETTPDGEPAFTIHQPMETDILTHGEHLSLKDAIMNAGDAARSARTRCRRTSTRKQQTLLERLSSLLDRYA